MHRAHLHSIQIGPVQSYGREDAPDAHDKPWTSGFFKFPVSAPVHVSTTGLAGDGQADLKHHGGVDKAVLAYSFDHYPAWRRTLQNPDFPTGAFGENLTISGLDEDSVFIGDVFQIGPVIVELSQPRQPCWKLARRWRNNELVAMVIANGRTGWYYRVLQEGPIEPGLGVTLLCRPNPDWSVLRANRILHHHKCDLELILRLAAVPKLASSWVKELLERADRLRAPVTA